MTGPPGGPGDCTLGLVTVAGGGDLSNEEVDAAIRERIEALSDGSLVKELKAQGETVVYLDGADIVRERPDGTREVLGRLDEQPGESR